MPFPSEWSYTTRVNGVGETASITIPAAPGITHVCTGFVGSISLEPNPAVGFYSVQLLNGASIIYFRVIALDQTAAPTISVGELGSSQIRPGSVNKSMTLRFVGAIPAGAALAEEFLELQGYDM